MGHNSAGPGLKSSQPYGKPETNSLNGSPCKNGDAHHRRGLVRANAWTEAQIKILRDGWAKKIPSAELAATLERSIAGVNMKAYELGLQPRIQWTAEQLRLLSELWTGPTPTRELSKLIGKSPSALKRQVLRLGLGRKGLSLLSYICQECGGDFQDKSYYAPRKVFCKACAHERTNRLKRELWRRNHPTPRACWSAEEKERVALEWKAGLPASRICTNFAGKTKSAILGLLHRMGLLRTRPKRPQKSPEEIRQRRRANLRRCRAKFGQHRPRAAGLSVGQFTVAPPSLNLTIIDIGPNQCRYIAGDDKLCCGHETVGNTSWCGHHIGIVFGGGA